MSNSYSSLLSAMNETSVTLNGALTNHSSLDANLDLFSVIGSSRGKDIGQAFHKAMSENTELAGRILLWARDIRGGAGERQTFRNLAISYLASLDSKDQMQAFIAKIVEVGRWDDLLNIVSAYDTAREPLWLTRNLIEGIVFGLISDALLVEKNALCAKWMPRKGPLARRIAKSMGIHNPKDWRKLVVSLSKTVEQQMCANRWSDVVYEHVPSIAASRYRKAFQKHDAERYSAYTEALSKGETKVNAAAIFPHDVIKNCGYGLSSAEDRKLVNAQWKSLPNYMEGSTKRILPMVDVSGSMCCAVPGTKNLQVIDVAVALGLYISERNTGIFKDQMLTFSEYPELVKISGDDIYHKKQGLHRASWGYNTNFYRAFETVLKQAQKFNLTQDQMPNQILVLSDMEFDEAGNNQKTNFQAIQKLYEDSGYEMPELVFWNLNARLGNVPVTKNDKHVCLVSGFSPSLLKAIVKGENFDPVKVMLDTVMVERYNH